MKIAIAMSGGVDSSVAAAILKQQGHELIGVTMRLFEPFTPGAGGPVRDAADVARHLGIPHHQVGLEQDFRHLIINDFVNEYRCGQTPQPLRALQTGSSSSDCCWTRRKSWGRTCWPLATTPVKPPPRTVAATCAWPAICARTNPIFSTCSPRNVWSGSCFPSATWKAKMKCGDWREKWGCRWPQRATARRYVSYPMTITWRTWKIRNGRLSSKARSSTLTAKEWGSTTARTGNTIGQRKGLGIAWSEPLYVVSLDVAHNRVIVGEERHVYAQGLFAADLNWITPPTSERFETTCKIRYQPSTGPLPGRAGSGGLPRRFSGAAKSGDTGAIGGVLPG